MNPINGLRTAITLAAIIIAACWLSLFLANRSKEPDYLSAALIITALSSFVGILALQQKGATGWELSESIVRTTVAGMFFITYIVMVALVIFWTNDASAGKQLPQITQTLLTNFTTVTGIVVAFYFGSSAYAQSKLGGDTAPKTETAPKSDAVVK